MRAKTGKDFDDFFSLFLTDNLIQAAPVIVKAKTNAPSETERSEYEDRLDLQELGCSGKANM